MNGPNTFQGLRFRIQETLEQAKGVPLMAGEITNRLCEKEYRGELRDNVMFRVTQALHAMKGKGQVLQHDARGPKGELTYVLPQRTKFPAAEGTKPANPVLPPELAEKIKTVELKETKPVTKPPVLAPGVYAAIIDTLDKADEPMTSRELADVLKHMYPEKVASNDVRINNIFAQHMHYLFKVTKRVKRDLTDKKHARYEFFTKKTGKRSKPTAAPADWVQPKPNVVTVETASGPTKVDLSKLGTPAPKQEKPALFKPLPVSQTQVVLTLKLTPEKHAQLTNMASRYNVSEEALCIQAIDFALEHSEG